MESSMKTESLETYNFKNFKLSNKNINKIFRSVEFVNNLNKLDI